MEQGQRRIDPVFGLPTPLLFAHRGGAREVEESTRRGFEHAVTSGSDVLELDVHVLQNGNRREFVVWHGPNLDNVLIDALPGDKAHRPARRSDDENRIYEWDWLALKGRAWVAHPSQYNGNRASIDLVSVPQTVDRTLLLLDEMLGLFPNHPVNIELKESVLHSDVEQLVSILDNHGGVKALVVALDPLLLGRFRKESGGRYPTGFSMLGVAGAILANWLPFNPFSRMNGNRAVQTTHDRRLTKPALIRKVQDRGGAVHVFLTAFTGAFPAIDTGDGEPLEEALFEVLDRGVDGVMTDRPAAVRPLIDRWLARPVAPTPAGP